MGRQLPDLVLAGVRSQEVTARVVLHLERFVEYLTAAYGHDRLLGGARGRVRWRDGHQAPEWAVGSGAPTWMAEPMASPSMWITEIGGKCPVAWSGASRARFISSIPAWVDKIMNGVWWLQCSRPAVIRRSPSSYQVEAEHDELRRNTMISAEFGLDELAIEAGLHERQRPKPGPLSPATCSSAPAQ